VFNLRGSSAFSLSLICCEAQNAVFPPRTVVVAHNEQFPILVRILEQDSGKSISAEMCLRFKLVAPGAEPAFNKVFLVTLANTYFS
jgi:hypothetical protein